MRLLLSLAAAALAAVAPAAAVSSTGSRVLVALEKGLSKGDYSQFWADLQGPSSRAASHLQPVVLTTLPLPPPARGYELTFKTPKDESTKLVEFGERNFDHVILFTPSTKSASALLPPFSPPRSRS